MTSRRFNAFSLASAGLFGLSAALYAQDAAVPVAVSNAEQQIQPEATPTAEETAQRNEAAVSSFLERRQARQQRREAALQRRGLNSEQTELRRLYRSLALRPPRPVEGLSAGTEADLAASLETDAVQRLASLGIKPRRIRALRDLGFDPLASMVSVIRGDATFEDYAILSDRVVLATLRRVNNEDLGDGYLSTAVFEVNEVLMGRDNPDRAVRIRQQSGKAADGSTISYSGDFRSGDTTTYLLAISRGEYEQAAVEAGATPSERAQLRTVFGIPYAAVDGTLYPTNSVAPLLTTVDALRARLAPLVRAKNQTEETTDAQ